MKKENGEASHFIRCLAVTTDAKDRALLAGHAEACLKAINDQANGIAVPEYPVTEFKGCVIPGGFYMK